MTQAALFLVVVAVIAGYTVRLAVRLAPALSEFPVKTFLASLLSAAVAFAEVFPYQVSEPLRIFTLAAAPVYAFGPLLAVALARLGRYAPALLLVRLIYWTAEGREAAQRLPAQVAVQRGDGNEALRLIPPGDRIMLAQAYALTGQWQRVLELEPPGLGEAPQQDRSFLGEAVRIQALVRLGLHLQARRALAQMRERWEAGGQGPLGYRSIRMSEARLAAEQGNLLALRELLGQPIPGIPAHELVALLALAAERAGRYDEAAELYRQAFTAAPAAWRERYAATLRELGSEPPSETGRGPLPVGTYGVAAAVVIAYLGQLALDAAVGPFAGPFSGPASGIEASSLAAAFLVGLPGLPEGDAWWRYLSYAFVHGNLLHIGFNTWLLVDIGRMLELRRGLQGLLASFVAGTAGGALIAMIAGGGGPWRFGAPAEPLILVGASAGVLGVAGALLADTLTSGEEADRALSRGLLRWLVLIALLSVAIPNVSLWGHVGGLAGGLLWGFLAQVLPSRPAVKAFVAATALALLLVALIRSVSLALRLAAL
jgi:rhomboid protease GluP